jgi:hypothetical protein
VILAAGIGEVLPQLCDGASAFDINASGQRGLPRW